MSESGPRAHEGERVSGMIDAISDEALGNTSYLVDVGQGAAVTVDPRRDAREHIERAARLGLRIEAVLETHLHADFVGGAREIAYETGANVYAAADALLSYDHTPVSPGERLRVGDTLVEVIGTPGHTPEHVAFGLTGSRGAAAVFSGGSLIVGGAARTDLTGADRTVDLARAQFASLRRLAALPDETVLCPTHGAGSFCSTGPARAATSTIGEERRTNALLSIDDEQAFVERLLSGFGTYPRYFAELRTVNREGAPLLAALPPISELDGSAAASAVERGAWLIDGRPVDRWARAHPSGAISIEVRPAFASWLGWVVPFGAPVVLVLDPEQVETAITLAHRIGYDRIEGWTTLDAWQADGQPVSSIELVPAEEAARRARADAVLLDVRQRSEFDARHITGATHIELGDVIAGKTPEASDVITYCGHGERSATAASLLARRGVRVANLEEGTSGWRRAGYAFSP